MAMCICRKKIVRGSWGRLLILSRRIATRKNKVERIRMSHADFGMDLRYRHHTCSMPSKQESYAANLTNGLGVALYHPLRFRSYSGRVENVAFLHSRELWVDKKCLSFGSHPGTGFKLRTGIRTTGNEWPACGNEEEAVTDETQPYFHISLDGNVHCEWKQVSVPIAAFWTLQHQSPGNLGWNEPWGLDTGCK